MRDRFLMPLINIFSAVKDFVIKQSLKAESTRHDNLLFSHHHIIIVLNEDPRVWFFNQVV